MYIPAKSSSNLPGGFLIGFSWSSTVFKVPGTPSKFTSFSSLSRRSSHLRRGKLCSSFGGRVVRRLLLRYKYSIAPIPPQVAVVGLDC